MGFGLRSVDSAGEFSIDELSGSKISLEDSNSKGCSFASGAFAGSKALSGIDSGADEAGSET